MNRGMQNLLTNPATSNISRGAVAGTAGRELDEEYYDYFLGLMQ
jgi:hypothetical protein